MKYVVEYLNPELEYDYYEFTSLRQLWTFISWFDLPRRDKRMECFHAFLRDPVGAINKHCCCSSVWVKEQ